MINKEEVLLAVKAKGYVVPSDLIKQFHLDTFIMGAVLSDLVSEKKLFISSVKIGGSPVYYVPEAKEKLQELFKYLNEKDKQTYLLLQERIVLEDAVQTPLLRVSLRALKDYAKPLEVTSHGETKLFWKWYLAPEDTVNQNIRALLFSEPAPQLQTPPHTEPTQQATLSVEPQELKLKKQKEQQPAEDFVQTVTSFFKEKNISFRDIIIIKKGEVDCIVEVPSPLGTIEYYCKAKNKKRCTEGEIASAFVAAQLKKLPALFLTQGEIPKKIKIQDYPNMKILTIGG